MRLLPLLLVATLASAQGVQQLVARGQEIYAKSCATGYCHGLNGAAGGAPRLASRGFDEAYIISTTRFGVKGTAMQAFGGILPRPDLAAVVAYVATLNGITPTLGRGAAQAETPVRTLPPEAARGRVLFFDSLRGFARCSTCHQLDGFGIPVTTSIGTVPANAAALRALVTPQVKTATSGSDSFPVLVLTQGARESKLYDLTSLPPVLRTFPSGLVKVADGSSWRHATAIAGYQDAELESILSFLREVGQAVSPAR
jgi:mono/diheme cytochrome c family protein